MSREELAISARQSSRTSPSVAVASASLYVVGDPVVPRVLFPAGNYDRSTASVKPSFAALALCPPLRGGPSGGDPVAMVLQPFADLYNGDCEPLT